MTRTYLVIAALWLGWFALWIYMKRCHNRRNPALQAEWRRQRVEEMMQRNCDPPERFTILGSGERK